MSHLIESRAEFQSLAETRLGEAKALLDLGKWDGAYYLAGYAVELALKACIIKKLMRTDAFPPKDFSRDSYTHDLEKLAYLADLHVDLKAAFLADPSLQTNWALVRDWSEQRRYHRIDRAEAEAILFAISDEGSGVLSWIKTRW